MKYSRKKIKQLRDYIVHSSKAKKHMLMCAALALAAIMIMTIISQGYWVMAENEEYDDLGDTYISEPAPGSTSDPYQEPGDDPDDETPYDNPTDPTDDPDDDPADDPDDDPADDPDDDPTDDPDDDPTDDPDEDTTGESDDEEDSKQIQTGSISGFLWVDGNGTLPSHWDGFYHVGEEPLAGYPVYLFNAADIAVYNALPDEDKIHDNMPLPVDSTVTFSNGTYLFYGVQPGSYVIGLASYILDGVEYLLPLEKAGISVFEINWDTWPVMAFSEIITITDKDEIININAGMRLPMGFKPAQSGRYLVYEGEYPGGRFVDSYEWLDDAVINCGTGGLWTIVATENDNLSYWLETGPNYRVTKIPLEKNITLTSDTGNIWTITSPSTRHLEVLGTLTLKNIILDGANTGGGLQVGDNNPLSIVDSKLYIKSGASIQRCSIDASNHGGGIMMGSGSIVMSDGSIINNRADGSFGGAVYIVKGTFTMTGGEISGNRALNGGGITLIGSNITDSIFTLEGGTISENTASGVGGAIYMTRTPFPFPGICIFEVNGGLISGNNAADGGGVFASGGRITITNGLINSNSANNGGAINASNTTEVTMAGGEISENTASNNGGGVRLQGNAMFTMNSGSILDNGASNGGGVQLLDTAGFTISGGEIKDNKASNSGGVQLQGDTSLKMTGGAITGNIASNNGGGVRLQNNSKFTMDGGSIFGNVALNGGGVQLLDTASLTMTGGAIENNVASNGGGGVHLQTNATLTMNGGTIKGNRASADGGGVRLQYNAILAINAGEIIGNTAGGDGGGIWTPNYERLQIADKAVFGRMGTDTENKASSYSDLWSEADYIRAFQTRYTAPTGIYSEWGPYYSTEANHPVNNFDINAIFHTMTVVYPKTDTSEEVRVTYDVGDGASFKLDGEDGRIIPDIEGYIFDDWYIGDDGTPEGTLVVSVDVVTDDMIIYLIFRPNTLTVSKKVDGDYVNHVNLNKDWEFTVYFFDDQKVPLSSGREFKYTIANSDSSQNGTLTLSADGSATFLLKHGDKIVIYGVPVNAYFRIEENEDKNYNTSYVDSIDSSSSRDGNDTGVLGMSKDRKFDFTNTFFIPPDMGVSTGTTHLIVLSLLAGTAGIGYIVISHLIRKRRRGATGSRGAI